MILLIHHGELWFMSGSEIGAAVASLLIASAKLLSEATGSSTDELRTCAARRPPPPSVLGVRH
jgi:hypothetical protein